MNVFDLLAKIGLDTSGYEDGLKKAEEKTSSFSSKIGSGIATAGKAVAAGIATAGGAVAKITKDAVSAYGDYEQMVGGVKTLFGANEMTLQEYAKSVGKTVEETKSSYSELIKAQNIVLQDAADAWKDVGMSANEYMENATSFAASLKQSLGGDSVKAAEKTKIALTDIADNANKMGTDMGSLTGAYQGFAKQNYTMLDNLKLGYGGTKQEMERLLADAEKLTGIKYDISKYGDIVDAIHAIQKEMNITGTTAKEAMKTIQGSAGMLKSAWKNLLTGLADENANIGDLVGDVSGSLNAVIDNISPRIEQALPAIAEGITELSKQALPLISSALIDFVPYIADGIATIISTISTLLPDLISATLDLATTLIPKLEESLGEVFQTVGASLPAIASKLVDFGQVILDTATDGINWVTNNFSTIISTLGSFVSAVADGLLTEDNMSKLTTAVTNLVFVAANWLLDPENLDKMLSCATSLAGKIGKGIEDAWEGSNGQPGIKDKLHDLIDNIQAEWTKYWELTGEELQMGFTGNIDEDYDPKTFLGKVAIKSYKNSENLSDEEAANNLKSLYSDEEWDKYTGIGEKIDRFLNPTETTESGGGASRGEEDKSPWEKIEEEISTTWDNVKEKTSETWENIKSNLSEKWEDIKTTLSETWESIETTVSVAWDNVKEKTSETWENIKSNLSEKWESIKSSASTTWDSLKTTVSTTWDNVKEKTSTTWENIKSTLTEKWESIKTSASNTWESMKTTVSDTWNSIKETAASKWEEIKTTIKSKVDSIVTSALTWGKDMIDNFVSGIQSAWGNLVSTVSNVASTVKSFLGFSEPEQGPLSDFHTYAPDMMELFAKGIKDNEYKVVGNVENVTSRIRNAFSNDYAVPNITTSSANNFNGSTSGSSTPVSGSVSVVNNFTINGENASEISDTVAEKIQEALEELQIRRELALGR